MTLLIAEQILLGHVRKCKENNIDNVHADIKVQGIDYFTVSRKLFFN